MTQDGFLGMLVPDLVAGTLLGCFLALLVASPFVRFAATALVIGAIALQWQTDGLEAAAARLVLQLWALWDWVRFPDLFFLGAALACAGLVTMFRKRAGQVSPAAASIEPLSEAALPGHSGPTAIEAKPDGLIQQETASEPAQGGFGPPSRRGFRVLLVRVVIVTALFACALLGHAVALVERLDLTRASMEERARDARALIVPRQMLGPNGRAYDAAIEMALYLPESRIPEFVKEAVIAREDRRFRSHFGVNPAALARALYRSAINPSGRLAGGSTITMQVVKNVLLSQERSLDRKINEIILALYLEILFTKDEILTMYLNRAYFGEGAYGIEAAARRYFGRSVGYEPKVSPLEAAMLAISLQSPSYINPARRRATVEARARALLAEMRLDNEALPEHRTPGGRKWRMQPEPFRDLVLREMVPDALQDRADPLVLGFTLDTEAQLYAELGATAMLREARAGGYDSSAILVLEPDGAVVALATGHPYDGADLVGRGRVSPGSALKPFIVLCALEKGMRPESLADDRPRDWPRNFDGRWLGTITLDEALRTSRNPFAVDLLDQFGPDCFADALRRAGIRLHDPTAPTAVLGSEHVSLLDLAAGYATLANGGRRAVPYAIRYARTVDGGIVHSHRPPRGARVFAGRPYCDLLRMLRSVTGPGGTGRNAAFAAPVWGKTGTSSGNRDALFVGFTDRYVAVVWLGRQAPGKIIPSLAATGGSLPAKYFRRLMATLHQGQSTSERACS